MSDSYTLEQFEEDMEKIFSYVPPGPRLVTCLRCGDTVKTDEDCSCGHEKKVMERLKERFLDA